MYVNGVIRSIAASVFFSSHVQFIKTLFRYLLTQTLVLLQFDIIFVLVSCYTMCVSIQYIKCKLV